MPNRPWTPSVYSLAWVVVGAAVVFWSVCFPLTNTDIWWHLAAGRQMLAEGRLLDVDPFGTGAPWINLHWLFQLGVFGVHTTAGLQGLVLAKSLLVAAAAALLIASSRGSHVRDIAVGALLVALSVHLSRHLVLARPVVVTLVAMALFFVVLERFRRTVGRTGGHRVLWWLMPIQLVWANAQGGLQLLGPALVLCYLAGDGLARLGPKVLEKSRGSLKMLGVCLLLLLGCCLLTPHGLEGLTLPFKLLGRIHATDAAVFSRNVTENIPPWLLERSAAPAVEVWSFKWVAALAFASFLPGLLTDKQVVLPRMLCLASLFVLALTANRNILLFNWLAAPMVVLNLSPLLERVVRRRFVVGMGIVLVVMGLVGIAWHRALGAGDEPTLAKPAPFRVPGRAVGQLRRQHPRWAQAALFNSVRYGGYLIWKLHPTSRPSIDGRLVLRSPSQFAIHLRLVDRPGLFDAFARHRGIRTVILPTALPDRYLPLVVHLYHDPQWQLAFTDGTQTLFLRRRAAGIDLGAREQVAGIARELTRRHRVSAVRARALLHLARLTAAVGAHEPAIELLREQRGRGARSLLARVLFSAGRRRAAGALARELVDRHGDNVNDLVLLARLAAEGGQLERAVGLLERALEQDPHSPQARQALSRIKAGQR